LTVGHIEVRQKHDLEAIAHIRIAVHHFTHCRDEFDHQLGEVVARGGLAAKNEGTRCTSSEDFDLMA